ncbi:cytochrome P450 [Mycena sp. CBHHK59/15]|nr:cytochrome P450 [Mycena sp. CBHHK59/15]
MVYPEISTSVLVAISIVLLVVLLSAATARTCVKNIPGPPSPSWLYGNMLQLLLPACYGDHEFDWQKQYGPVYRIKGCFGKDILLVSDPLALQHILNSSCFDRSPTLQQTATLLFGSKSVFCSKGDYHGRLRAAMNPAFTAVSVRKFLPIFQRAARAMTETLEETSMTGSATDLSPALNSATLRTVNEVADSILAYLPPLVLRITTLLPTAAFRTLSKYASSTKKVGTRLVDEKVQASLQGLEMSDDVFGFLLNPDALGGTRYTLSPSEVAAQTAIFLIAGSLANALAFGFYELAKHPAFQIELRAEIQASLRSNLGRDIVYDSMPLLNAFLKEILRLYPAGPLSNEIALRDTVLPLTNGIVTATGEHISSLPIKKGQLVTMAVASYQRLTSLWGSDANEFKPSRWPEGTASQGEALGPYAHLLTFFGGRRTCLGLLEMQVIVCELISNFSFTVPENDSIRPCYANVLMPALPNGEKAVPLCINRLL